VQTCALPILIGDYQSVGNFELATSLRRDEKGVNMSRLLEALETENNNGVTLDFETLEQVLLVLRNRMRQDDAEVTADGKWYFSKPSPGANLHGIAHADVGYSVACNESVLTRTQFGMTHKITTICTCFVLISAFWSDYMI